MPYYEIINPSDKCTMKVPAMDNGMHRAIAMVANLLLGTGLYGLHEVADNEGKLLKEIFGFGGSEETINKWFSDQFAMSLAQIMHDYKPDVAACLESCIYGSVLERITVDEALAAIDDPAKRTAFLDKWLDRKRTSMNNIALRAQQLAKYLRGADFAVG